MSHKIDLSTFTRDGSVSLTQQLVDRFAAAIDSGSWSRARSLRPRASWPPRSASTISPPRASTAGWPSTGYVTAEVGRGTFVRSLAPAGIEEYGDDWQVYALPEYDIHYPERVLAEAFASAGDPDLISLALGWPSPRLYPTEEAGPDHGRRVCRGGWGGALYLSAEGLYELREQLALRGREVGYADSPDEIMVTWGRSRR